MKKGFTLIEYIVTISLIGLLASAFVLSASNFLPSVRLNGSTNNLTSNLRQAQEEAVTAQMRYAVRFNAQTNPTGYQIIKISADTTEDIVKTVTIPSNLTVDLDPTIADAEIYFSPDGGPSSFGNITLSSAGKSKVVNISPAGVIKIQ